MCDLGDEGKMERRDAYDIESYQLSSVPLKQWFSICGS